MVSLTFNKIAGAILGTCTIGMGLGILGEAIYVPGAPSKPGYALPEPTTETAEAPKKAPDAPLPVLLAKADVKKGESDAKVCGACHNFVEGAGSKVGPDLYGVVDRDKGSVAGFDYSTGLKAKGGKWTYADLNTWLLNPAAYIAGTKMGYPGEDNAEKRADIIAYLRSLSASPAALPPVTDADKAAGDTKTAAAGEPKTAEAAAPAAGGGDDFTKLVAAADPKKGQSESQVCGACHNLKEGGGIVVGPPLWGVVDRDKGAYPGFDYSTGLKAKGGKWTYADLNTWLTNPAAYVAGTKMGYAGEASEKKRAEIVAYLRTLAKTPAPLDAAATAAPKPEPAAAMTKAAPAPTPAAPAPDPAADAAPAPASATAATPPAATPPAATPPATTSDPSTDDKGPQPYSAPSPDDAK